jgi:hypothetical protein
VVAAQRFSLASACSSTLGPKEDAVLVELEELSLADREGSHVLSAVDRDAHARQRTSISCTRRRFDSTSPFGAHKESGLRREGGVHGVEAYVELRQGQASPPV